MIKRNDILADMHIHTISSLHAYSTLKECIDTSYEQGLHYIAVTDHYFCDGTDINKKNESNRIAYMESRVNGRGKSPYVIGGAEFNIGQEMPYWKKLSQLRWRLIGVHSWHINRENTTLDELYRMFEEASDKYKVVK